MDCFYQCSVVHAGGVISIQSATTIFEEAISELNCAVDSMCTVLDIVAKLSFVACGGRRNLRMSLAFAEDGVEKYLNKVWRALAASAQLGDRQTSGVITIIIR